jgi:uncharacterized protein (AIM24 family)
VSRSLVYLILAPAYLALASGVFLGVNYLASLALSSGTDQMALALIGTGVVLTGCVKLIEVLDR